MSPGSMPLSTELYQEGIIIPPIKLVDGGRRNEAVWQLILRNVRTPWERDGDLAAQLAAHATGAERLQEIVGRYGLDETMRQAHALIAYAETLTRAAIARIPDGRFTASPTPGRRRPERCARTHLRRPDVAGDDADGRLRRHSPGRVRQPQCRAGHCRIGRGLLPALRGPGPAGPTCR
jgi:hypothetical protein